MGGKVSKAHLRKEPAAQAIIELAAEINADLVVMGSRGVGSVRRILLGSVSENVVHRAGVPVLVLRGGDEAWPPERVVVGEDSSQNADCAGELAARFAEFFGAGLLLAHVVSSQWMVFEAGAQGTEMAGEVMRRAEEHLAEQAEKLESSSGVRPDTRAATGYPALTLAEVAEEEKRTLLVVGSRGLKAVKRTMLGSVSSTVLKTVEARS